MTIRTRLTINVFVVILIIGAVSVTSLTAMRFVRNKLSYLTEQSTPFQMKTVEFQRAIQGATADLIKVSVAGNLEEFGGSRKEALASMAVVETSQRELETLSGGERLGTHAELQAIASEILAITEKRLTSDKNALDANKTISGKLRETAADLKILDDKIKTLQRDRTKAYASSYENTRAITARLRNIEAFRNDLKDLQMAVLQVDRASSKKRVLIAQGKYNVAIGKIRQNPFLAEAKNLQGELKTLGEKVDTLVQKQLSLMGQPNDELKKSYEALNAEANEKISTVMLSIEGEAASASERYGEETGRQGNLFRQSAATTLILASNSELVSLGTSIAELSTRLFTLTTPDEVTGAVDEINRVFDRIAAVEKSLLSSLREVKADREEKVLRGVSASLSSIRDSFLAGDGVITTVRTNLDMLGQSRKATGKLRAIVLRQAEKGKATVTLAQGAQQQAVGAVNSVVRFSTVLVGGIGLGAVLFGVLFGIWIYRSIARPLGQLIVVSDRVAKGDLSTDLDTTGKDEVGKVQASMAAMVTNLRGMVGRIKDATGSLASSSEELSATASSMERGSEDQTRRIEQSASAMTEMSQTTMDVARNSTNTAEAAARMRDTAEQGKTSMHTTVQELNGFANMVKVAAGKVESLGVQSAAISAVVSLIKGIADQTNLLALNAAIEAARAGDAGRGFAVVADEVRALAEKTAEATNNITETVIAMQGSVADSVTFMQSESASIDSLMEHVNHTLAAIDDISRNVEQVTDMVARIAVAAEQQSSTAGEVTNNVEQIAAITRVVRNSFADITNSSESLAKLATGLDSMVGWFTVEQAG